MGWTFFGLTAAYKLKKEEQIHDLAFHSNGAFSYTEIVNMPTYIRTFHINRLNAHFKKQKEEHDKQARKMKASRVKKRR